MENGKWKMDASARLPFSILDSRFSRPAVLLVAALSGCTVGPDYETPKASVPSGWVEAPSNPVDPAALARWWGLFGVPELDRLVARVAADNLDLAAAAARIREARAQYAVTTGGAWPELGAGAGYERRRRSENNSFRPRELDQGLYDAGFDLSWEIDLFGRLTRGREAAAADIAAVVEDRRDVLLSLQAETARTYFALRGLQRRLAGARDAVRTLEETVELTRSRFAAGLTSELDVVRAQSLLERTRAQVPALEADLRRAGYRLAVLAGLPPGALDSELEADRSPAPESPAIAAGTPSELLRRRPDIRRAERELAAATARIGVATSDLYPRITLSADLGLQSENFADLFAKSSHAWLIAPSVSWPIFRGGTIRANIRLQEARQERALARYRKAVLTSLEEAENALASHARERERRRSLAASAESAARAAALAEELYANGLADFLSVLDARRTFQDAQDLLIQSEIQTAVNTVALGKALGGGWVPED